MDWGAHCGGDLVGGACRLLMKHAGSICTNIEILLLTINHSNGEASSNKEITEKCEAYAEALEQFDALLAMLQIPSGIATPPDFAAAHQHAKLD